MGPEEKIAIIQLQLRKHTLSTFTDDHGMTVPGCPACRKRLHTVNQFVEHLAVDVIPALKDPGAADVWALVRAGRAVIAANNNVGGLGSMHELTEALPRLEEALSKFPILQ